MISGLEQAVSLPPGLHGLPLPFAGASSPAADYRMVALFHLSFWRLQDGSSLFPMCLLLSRSSGIYWIEAKSIPASTGGQRSRSVVPEVTCHQPAGPL